MEDNTGHIAHNFTITDGERTYVLGKLKITHLRELEDYLRGVVWEDAKKEATDLPIELAKHVLDAGKKAKDAIRIGEKAFDNAMKTINGTVYMFYLSLRQNHADISRAKAEELFNTFSMEKAAELVAKTMTGITGQDDQSDFPKGQAA